MKHRLLTDSDWANEARGRQAYIGGALLAEGHIVQHGCRRPPVVALISGAAEVHIGVCGSARVVCASKVLKELVSECWGDPMEDAVDASICKSTFPRNRPSGIKHLETKPLWVLADRLPSTRKKMSAFVCAGNCQQWEEGPQTPLVHRATLSCFEPT